MVRGQNSQKCLHQRISEFRGSVTVVRRDGVPNINRIALVFESEARVTH